MTELNNKKDALDPFPESQDEAREEFTLRPKTLPDYVGQTDIKERLSIFIAAAKKRKESLDHVLFSGPPGLGKTTLAHIIANELEVGITTTSGPVLERAGDLAAILTNLKDKEVLFIDEIHRLNRTVEEILYPAMEDYKLDIIIGQGPSARTLKIDIPRFTLIGATTRTGLLTSPLRDRFGVAARLEYYSNEELSKIIARSASLLNITIDKSGSDEIAKRARGTPRIANRLLKRIRDYAEVKAKGHINIDVADKALKMLDVDNKGFDKMDRSLMLAIIDKFEGGPVGLDTLSAALNEESNTIEDVYEPFLIQCGYLKRTPRGRMATDLAYKYFGKQKKINDQRSMF